MGSVNAEMNADITNFFKLIKGIKYHRKLCILLNLNQAITNFLFDTF